MKRLFLSISAIVLLGLLNGCSGGLGMPLSKGDVDEVSRRIDQGADVNDVLRESGRCCHGSTPC
jgi:hypothetical protein